jgi:hypothetical protein
VRAAVLVLLGMVLGGNLRAQVPPCASLKTPDGIATGYKARGNRCEGLYVADVSANNLELISLTQGDIHYRLAPGVVLQVSSPERTNLLNVRSVAKPPKMYYRMDATLSPGSLLKWPVEDVLLPERLDELRIGIFGWYGSGDAKVFVPLLVEVQGQQRTAGAQNDVVFTVRPSFDTEAIKWRSGPFNGDTCAAFGNWRDAPQTSILAGQYTKINLGVLRAPECVEVAASSQTSNDWTTMRVRVGPQ